MRVFKIHHLVCALFLREMISYRCYSIAILWFLALNNGGLLLLSNGGTTSSFIRNEEKSIDMPFDSDVFHAPSGYNAPQQVFLSTPDIVEL